MLQDNETEMLAPVQIEIVFKYLKEGMMGIAGDGKQTSNILKGEELGIQRLARAVGQTTPEWYNFDINKWTKEFTVEKLWTSRDLRKMSKYFFGTLLVSFSPSIVDMVTDYLSAYSYFFGTEYIKHVDNTTDTIVEGCELVTTTLTTSYKENITFTSHQFSCFEKDPIYGGVTLFFTFLPSVIFVYCAVYQGTLSIKRWYSIFTIPLFLATFPIQLIVAKALHLINPGKNMKLLSEIFAFCESQGESTFQLCAQLFMVLSRSDREASYLQIVSIAASSVLVVKPSLELFLGQKKNCGNLEKILSKYAKFLPLFLFTTIFRILSIAIICVLLRWNAVYFYIAVFGGALLARLVTYVYFTKSFILFDSIVPENLTITRSYQYGHGHKKQTLSNMILWTIVNGVILTIIAFFVNNNDQFNIVIPSFFPFVSTDHHWAEIPLVNNLLIFNSLYIIILVTGTLSFILFWFQIFVASRDPDGERI